MRKTDRPDEPGCWMAAPRDCIHSLSIHSFIHPSHGSRIKRVNVPLTTSRERQQHKGALLSIISERAKYPNTLHTTDPSGAAAPIIFRILQSVNPSISRPRLLGITVITTEVSFEPPSFASKFWEGLAPGTSVRTDSGLASCNGRMNRGRAAV